LGIDPYRTVEFMAAQGGGSGSEKGAEGDEALARALKNLELREGELDGVFIGE
jgi:hypothetical protein